MAGTLSQTSASMSARNITALTATNRPRNAMGVGASGGRNHGGETAYPDGHHCRA